MRKKRYFKTGAILFYGLAIVALVSSIVIAYSNNFNPLPWDPSFVIGVGLISCIILVGFGSALLWFDTSWGTPLHRHMVAYTPDRDTIARVLTNGGSKKEFFIYGKPDSIVRDVVREEWPFDEELKSYKWRVLDQNGLDVSLKNFSDVNGILRVVLS